MNVHKLFLAALTAALLTSSAAADTIDNFSDPGSNTSVPGGDGLGAPGLIVSNGIAPFNASENIPQDAVTGAAGGFRDTTLSIGAGAFQIAQALVDGGQLAFTGAAGATGDLAFLYDANGAGLSLDVSDDQGLTLDFDSYDANGGSLPVTVTLTDGAANSDSVILSPLDLAPGAGDQLLNFAYSDFTGLDLTDIDSIQVSFAASAGQNFVLNSIASTPAPEPGTLGICGVFGAVCFAGRRIRRRRQLK